MSNGVIQIDPRTGSKELLQWFTPGKAVISPVQIAADFHFVGNGPDGTCLVGIERKTAHEVISDFERFAAQQLRPLLTIYKFCYLVIEGPIVPGTNGRAAFWDGREWRDEGHSGRGMHFDAVFNRVHTLQRRLNVHVLTTMQPAHTARVVECVYNWFQRGWNTHKSYEVEYTPPPSAPLPRYPSVMEKMLVQIPSVGWKTAVVIAAKFKTMSALCAATRADIAEIKIGRRRVGDKCANDIKQMVGDGQPGTFLPWRV